MTITGRAWACEGKATMSSSPTTLRSLGTGRTTVEEETLVVLLAEWGGRIKTRVADPHLIRLEEERERGRGGEADNKRQHIINKNDNYV